MTEYSFYADFFEQLEDRNIKIAEKITTVYQFKNSSIPVIQ